MTDVQGDPGLGPEILEVLRTRGDDADLLLEELGSLRERTGAAACARALELLTGLGFDEGAAERSLRAICSHRSELSGALGRDPGLAIAAFDYFVNVDRRLQSPRMIEISEYQEIERLAETDSLTGLANRRRFRSLAHRELRRSERYGQRASILFMDLDDFKEVNDRWGHHCGDLVLREVARVLRGSLREVDMASRYGGEEFALLLPETGKGGAVTVAERIRARVSERFATIEVDGRALPLTLSAGIAEFPTDAPTLDGLLRRADEALYAAKSGGKNQVVAAFAERRRWTRTDLADDGMLPPLLIEDGSGPGGGRPLNISRGGALLVSDRPLEVGASIRMRLAPPGDPRPPIHLTGRVVRRRPQSNRAEAPWELGVAFQSPPGEEPEEGRRLEEWLVSAAGRGDADGESH